MSQPYGQRIRKVVHENYCSWRPGTKMRDNVESMKDAVEKHHLQTLHDILSHSSTLQRENEELKLKVKLLRQTNKSLADLCDELRGAFEGIGSTAS